MADIVTLQSWLSEAEIARHKLATGKQAVTIEYEGGGSVTYTKADLDKLEAYIASLRSQLSSSTSSPAAQRRPVHLGF